MRVRKKVAVLVFAVWTGVSSYVSYSISLFYLATRSAIHSDRCTIQQALMGVQRGLMRFECCGDVHCTGSERFCYVLVAVLYS